MQFGPIGELIDVASSTAANVEAFANNVNRVAGSLTLVEDFLCRLKKAMKMNDKDELATTVCGRVESLILTVWLMSQQTSLHALIAVAVQYVKTWNPNSSVTVWFGRLVGEIFQSMTRSGNDELHIQSGWFSDNWQVVTKGPLGLGLGTTITAMMMVGILPQKTDNVGALELFKVLPENPISLVKTGSLIEYVFSSLDWLVDCVWPALNTGDLSLLINDRDTDALSSAYRICLDAVQRSVVGQSSSVKDLYGLGSDAEILNYLQKTIDAHQAFAKRLKPKDPRRVEIQNRLIRLDKLVCDFTASWHDKGLRVKPYTYMIIGGSSVGKSTVAGIVQHVIARVNGLPEGKEYACTLNGNDKFQSEFNSKHVHVLFDDVGNARPEVTDGNPTTLIVQFSNNIHTSALSAEVEKKGKNDIRISTLGITSNTPDLWSSYYSVNPASIMRRGEVIIEVELKPDCVGPNGGIHPRFAKDPMPDAWNFTVSTVEICRSGSDHLADSWRKKPVFFDNRSMKPNKVGIVELVEYLERVTPIHFATQAQLVETSCEMHLKEHCEIHPNFTIPCKKCAMHPDESFIALPETPLVKQAGRIALPELDVFFLDGRLVKHDALPRIDEDSELCQLTIVERVQKIVAQGCGCISVIGREIREKCTNEPWIAILGVIAAAGVVALTTLGWKQQLEPEEGIIKRINEASKKPTLFLKAQNCYQRVYTNMLGYPKASVSGTLAQLERIIDNALHLIVIQRIDEMSRQPIGGALWANAFPVGSCCFATVQHLFEPGCAYSVKFQSSSAVGVKRVTVMITEVSIYRHPSVDMCVLNVPSMGDNANLSKYMPDREFSFPDKAPLFMYNAHKSQVLEARETMPPSCYKACSSISGFERRDVRGFGEMDLLMYECDNFSGMCGSLLVMPGRHNVIVGMHCSGIPDKKISAAIPLEREFLEEAVRSFKGVRIKETSPFPESILGRPIHLSNVVHEKNPVHYIESEDTNLRVFGQHDQPLSKFKSDVIVSPMAEHVVELFGVEVEHGAPKKDGARPSFRRFMINGSEFDETKLVNPSFVAAALEDAKASIDDEFFEIIREHVHPLCYGDALNGVPLTKGFEPVNPKTSMGFPLNRPKFKFFEQSPLAKELGLQTVRFVEKQLVDGKETYVYDLRFDEDLVDVQGAVEQLFTDALEDRRSNVVFRCNLKDEAVTYKKIEEKKIRVFSGAPVHFVIASRMLNLANQQLQKMFPETFECAVGANAVGRDWGHIYRYITQFGEEFCGDGDYSAFDQTIDPQFAKADMDFRRWFLEKCGFGDELLSIFDGIATETMFPLFELDGLIFSAFRLSASGTPDTVERNSGQNRLIVRYCYYSANRTSEMGKIPLFKDICAVITYGDDIVLNFNVVKLDELGLHFGLDVLSHELDSIGMKFTNAQKTFHTQRYMHVDDVSFLKRKFFLHPQLGERVGCLEMKSIFKSLTTSKRPKAQQRETVAEICAGNLNGALREFYWHGEDVYDEHLPKIMEIARRTIDAEGHKVADYFKPVTKDEIVEGFKDTFTVYEPAKEKLTMQSGVLEVGARVIRDVSHLFFARVVDFVGAVASTAVVVACQTVGHRGHLVYNCQQQIEDWSRDLVQLFFKPLCKQRIGRLQGHREQHMSTRFVGDALVAQAGELLPKKPPILTQPRNNYLKKGLECHSMRLGSYRNAISHYREQVRNAMVNGNPPQMQAWVTRAREQMERLREAEEERLQYESVYREASRAYQQIRGFHTGIGLSEDLVFFGDYEVMVDLCSGSTCIDRTSKFVQEYTEWVENGQFEEKSGCGTNVFGGQMADNKSVGVHYYGPRPCIRAFHMLGALTEVMDDPYKPMQFTEGVVLTGVDEATSLNVLAKMKEVYGYIEDSWWRKEIWTGSRVEVEYGSRSLTGRLNYSVSDIVQKELNEIEFELGSNGVFPKFLKLREFVINQETNHFVETNALPLVAPQLAEQA